MSVCSDPGEQERTDHLNKLFGSLDWELARGRQQPLGLRQRGIISPRTEVEGTKEKTIDLFAPKLLRILHQDSKEEEIKVVEETEVSEVEPVIQPEQSAETEQIV